MQLTRVLLVLLMSVLSVSTHAQANFPIQNADTIYSNTLNAIQSNRNPIRVLELLKSVGEVEECKNDSLLADLFYFYGSAYGQLGKFDSSHFYLGRALEISRNGVLPLNEVGSLIAQGNVYWGMEFYHLALEKYQKAYELAEKYNGPEFDTFLVMTLGNIGGIYAQLKDFEKAFEYVLKSNEVGARTNNLRPRSHMKIGRYLIDLNRPKEAIDSLRHSLVLINSHKDSVALVHCYEYFGSAYLQMNKNDSALYYFNLSDQTGNRLGYQLDDIVLNRGLLASKSGNKQVAKNYFQQGLETYIAKGKLEGQAQSYELLAQWAKDNNQPQLALLYFEKFKQTTDSIHAQETAVRVHELETKFEVKKKEDEIARLQLENKLSDAQLSEARWQIVMVSMGTLFVVLLAIVIFFFNRKKQRADLLAQQLQYDALLNRTTEILNGPRSVDLDHSLDEFNKILHNPLTTREYEILQASLEGKTNQEIADQMFVSLSTVKFHLGNVYNKFGVTNKKEALEYVVKSS